MVSTGRYHFHFENMYEVQCLMSPVNDKHVLSGKKLDYA